MTTCSSLNQTGARISKAGQVVKAAILPRAARQVRQTRGLRPSKPVTCLVRALTAQNPTTCINQDTMEPEQARAIRTPLCRSFSGSSPITSHVEHPANTRNFVAQLEFTRSDWDALRWCALQCGRRTVRYQMEDRESNTVKRRDKDGSKRCD